MLHLFYLNSFYLFQLNFFYCRFPLKVKGINYNLQHFLGPLNGSSDGSTIKLNNSEVKTRVHFDIQACSFVHWANIWRNRQVFLFLKFIQKSRIRNLILNFLFLISSGKQFVPVCDLFSTRRLSPIPFTDRLEAGNSKTFSRWTFVSESENCSMAAWIILFEWTRCIHWPMETWIL